MTVAAVASLVVGVVIGFVGQRSRMCFVGGIRDWILVRDTFLLKGLVAFVLVAWVLFPVFAALGGVAVPEFGRPTVRILLMVVAGGFGVGYVSILANGCPFRQHVLAAQGTGSSMAYLGGFYTGAVLFHVVVSPVIGRVLI
ncbi:MAG: YeeE/YedE thiosulfate transporter family protein [Acidimicrobiia bacterium]|nr:YeeE/YedE thiosulfate transporter family protein [Acidimicrobiia bacterium]